jgi:methanogenic corrinoid protein MtbC1
MVTDDKTHEILKRLHNAVVEYDEKKVADTANEAVDLGVDAYRAIMEGLAKGMEAVGELYTKQEYYVAELLLCADALYVGLDILRPHIDKTVQVEPKRIVLGVVEGDVHDIGKNLVKIMFDAAGWEVQDLGNDVKIGRFAEEQKRTSAQVVGISALMTTSMLAMPKIIKMVKDGDPRAVVIVGGAPMNSEIARAYGADGYADNAGEAVAVADSLLARR